jgi:hypothetical protein
MWREKQPYATVLANAKKIRPAIQPNSGFVEQLLLFEKRNYSLGAADGTKPSDLQTDSKDAGASAGVNSNTDQQLCSELITGLRLLDARLQQLVLDFLGSSGIR